MNASRAEMAANHIPAAACISETKPCAKIGGTIAKPPMAHG